MKLNITLLIVLVISFLGWKAFAGGYLSGGDPGAYQISVHQAKEQIENGKDIQILDVRTDREWTTGVVENSLLINIYDPEFQQKLEQLDKVKPVILICRSGQRSNQAMRTMAQMGFKELYNVRGGINSWSRAGFELKK